MSKIFSVKENWKEITERLRSDKQELAQFLRFSAKMYKHSFSDAALIYQQNPDATKVTELSVWNKLGRLVNRGERSIAVFGEGDKCRYLFDISQTNGKRIPDLWKLDKELSAELTAVINKKYGKSCKNIQETIAAMSVDNMKPYFPDMQLAMGKMKLSESDIKKYQQSVVSAVRFVVSNRCELDSEMKISGGINLNAADLFKDNRDLIRFCDMVQRSAKDTLLEMEREVVRIMKKRREKSNELQTKSDRTVRSGNTVHGRSGRTETSSKADRQVGENVAGVGENRISDGSSNSRNGGTLEHNTERNRQRGGEQVSRAGRAVPQGKSPSADIRRNTDVGENKNISGGTSADERGSIPSEVLTVENLIERYKNADFNKRLDSYQVAGRMLSDTQDTKLNPIDYFNKFEADKYSDYQAQEIRNIIEAVLKNKVIDEPVIIKNEVVKTTKIPPMLDESLISGIMKHDEFFHIKRDKITRFIEENEDIGKRCEFLKKAFNPDYSELYVNDTRVGYKTSENGLTVWEGSYLSRTKETVLSWEQVQSFIAELVEKGEYLDKPEVDEPVFTEPEENETIEPEPVSSKGEQLTLFGEPVPIDQPEKKAKNNKYQKAVSNIAPTVDMVDHVLRGGGNEPKSLERIVAQFQKGKSTAENAEFLRREFGEDGKGYNYSSADFGSTAQIAAWFDNSGVTVAVSNTAFPEGKNAHIYWEQAAERINELLEKGKYCSQDVIDRAADNELKSAADNLWYLRRECKIEYFIPKEMFEDGFPESTERIKAALADKETLQKYIDGMADLVKKYEENPEIIRSRFYNPKEIFEHLKDLQTERREFITKPDFKFEPKLFITEDEKDKLLLGGSNVEGGRPRIAKFFSEGHSKKEKMQFLKKEYGIGGSGHSGFDTWYDGKGIKFSKGDIITPDCSVLMKWNEVADRIDRLVSEGKYINVFQNTKAVSSKEKSISTDTVEETAASETVLEDEAVFMDISDGSFIALSRNDSGIEYTIYSPDLMQIDGGEWETEEIMELSHAASSLMETSIFSLKKVPDYDKFIELADTNTDIDITAELAKIKSELMPEKKTEEPAVNTPERIQASDRKEHKSGVPYTYHFSETDVVSGGAKSKFKANVDAIRTLHKVESENRYATPEEQAIMAKYVGWGGIPQAFTTDRAADSIGNLGDTAPNGWESEQKQLRELLSDDEYKAARASTLTSFYSPPEVTDGVYQALSQFGFEGGNILEPSMGVGNFFAKMPDSIRDNSKLYGVELDDLSGRIAQQLYPNERIQIKGFEQTNFNNNSFDVVLGNIPFGDYRVRDKAYDKYNFKIHDYFAAKAVDKVKPGGVVALVTSKFTMDKQNEKARRYLAERCDLLGAVRLPNTAFKKNAGTEVTTDILFLKKRDTMTVEVPDWVHMKETEDGIPCNQYFVDNPDMVLGKMAWDERMNGKYGDDSKSTTCTPDNSIPLDEQIKKAVEKIHGRIETVRSEEKEKKVEYIPADPSVRNFTHTLVDGQLYFRENEVMIKAQETGKTLDRMMGMHKIRLAAMAVIDAQAENCTDEELKKLQTDLNAVYDKFVKKYGNVTDSVNERCFRHDDDYNTLAALEIIDTKNKTVEKAEIFSKRTIQPAVEVISVDTPLEALQVSVDRLGKVDIPYMAELTGCEPEKLIADLGNEVFRNPEKIKENELYSGYEDASEYLSGNVRKKLKIAQEYAKHIDSSFEKNVSALEKVIPKDLEASEISVRIGSNWIDVEDYNRFLEKYAQADMDLHPVTRTRMGEYKIEGKYQDKSVAANEQFGTSRMSSYHIFENLLNQRDIVVRDRREIDGKVTYEINAKETQIAKEKARQMKEAFKSWVWEDIDRREKYVEKYNYLFNAIRGREYDGSHQTFPGMNPAIKLRPHQENAVLRGKLGGNTLLAHCVGAGKSFEMIATTMEKKRLGLINKGCVVVPKHLTLQMASEWMRLYPNAKLLVARPEDFTKDNRQKFIARCVTGDYDAVIMSFTQFERIPMSDQYRQQFMEKELDEIMEALQEVDSEDRVSVKSLERQQRKVEERLDKLMSSKKDNSLCFEKLGFDYLVVDEAHNYKNCFVATKMSNVAGVQTTAAQKSEDMLMKTQYLNEKYGCNNILYSTGTPVSNSMVEFYVMQRYLRPDLLENAGLETFDDWAGTFGEVVSQLEIKPAGNGFQMKNRFSKFVNIPELMQMYKEFADIQTPDMIKLPVPKLKTGQPIIVTAKPDDMQKAYMKELAARSEAIHNGNVDPKEDNMLKITHEARLLGLDSRCIFTNAEPTPDSKVMMLLDNLEKNYHETMEQKGVQIVFCDIAINEDAEHFSVYEAIKADLVKRGIPREEICFAGDAKTDKAKAEMFEQLRKGEKRFIIASTSKLGTGANIQDKICAIHHLDIPWKPADLTQQDGRGIRQGNSFDEVGIYHYLTENTFDAYLMGIITNKAKFISQIMTSKDPVRVSEDVDETVLTYSEMQAIASGNPMIKEKIQLDNDIAVLKTLEAEHKKSTFKLQELAERKLPQAIENYADLLQKASADLKNYQEQHPDNAEFSIELDGKKYTERAEAGDVLEKAVVKCSIDGETRKLGKYFGFDVSIEKNPANSSLFTAGTPCVAVLQGNLKYTTEVSLDNNVGNMRRIENLADSQINQRIKNLSAELDKAKNDLETAKANVSKPFERAAELAEKQKRLDFVNKELSKNSGDDIIPVADTQDIDEPIAASDVVVAMPAMATADRFNFKQLYAPTEKINNPAQNLDKPKPINKINNKVRR